MHTLNGNVFLCHIEMVGAGQTRPPARILFGICAQLLLTLTTAQG